MYTTINFKSKKALKEAVAKGESITVFQPNDMFGNPAGAPDYSGRACVEGPHYPEPHRWYATVIIEKGEIVKVS
jgi:hypothetical protein